MRGCKLRGKPPAKQRAGPPRVRPPVPRRRLLDAVCKLLGSIRAGGARPARARRGCGIGAVGVGRLRAAAGVQLAGEATGCELARRCAAWYAPEQRSAVPRSAVPRHDAQRRQQHRAASLKAARKPVQPAQDSYHTPEHNTARGDPSACWSSHTCMRTTAAAGPPMPGHRPQAAASLQPQQ